MKRNRYTASVIIVALLMGLTAGIIVNNDVQIPGNRQKQVDEHALFYIQVNGTDIGLKTDRFNSNITGVQLENNSHIVHKNASGVTWGKFLETINTSINRTGKKECLSMPGKTYCGNMKVMLNGKQFQPGKTIEQGDKLAIVIGKHPEKTAKAIMELKLPRKYRKTKPGTKI